MSIPTQFIRTSELDKRFNIGKNTRVNRLAMLGLTPDRLIKEGRYYLLTNEQLDLFTDFDKYILETGSCDGYPKLFSTYSDNPTIPDSSIEEDSQIITQALETDRLVGQLATTTNPDLESLASLASGQLPFAQRLEEKADQWSTDIFSSVTGEFTGAFTGTLPSYQVGNSLTQQLVANAQSRATAMLLAESALADQYINNPHLLNPDLRAQVDSFQYSKIDPKGLAASLVATAQRLTTAA
jgi:hypothetical protein